MAFCLEKQKEPIEGRRKRQDGEGGMRGASHRWMDGWMEGREGGMQRDAGEEREEREEGGNERAEWF